jgi:hypothetical protein
LTCLLGIRIQPLKQGIKWFLSNGQLSFSSLEPGDRYDVCREVRKLGESLDKTSSDAGQ